MTKFYKNPQRDQAPPTYKPYVPQYKLHGLEPEDFASKMERKKFNTPNQVMMVKGSPNMFNAPKAPSIGRNVPFAEIPTAPDNTYIPNVGNNVENTWAGLDGDIIDDIGIEGFDGTKHMIDNNDYVKIDNISTKPMVEQEDLSVVHEEIQEPTPPVELQDDEYLLVVEDTIIATGSLAMIEGQVKDLIFGDHELCGGKQIPIDDLMVLKRVKIKVGVFVDG